MSGFGIDRSKITPLWLEANGEAERSMPTLNNTIRVLAEEHLAWKNQLPTFLRLYRGSPDISTRMSRFEALTGRKMKIRLPDSPIKVNNPDISTAALLEMTTSASVSSPAMLMPRDTQLKYSFFDIRALGSLPCGEALKIK